MSNKTQWDVIVLLVGFLCVFTMFASHAEFERANGRDSYVVE